MAQNGQTGQWQGALKLLEHVAATHKQRHGGGGRGGAVTPAMAKAAAAICVRAGKVRKKGRKERARRNTKDSTANVFQTPRSYLLSFNTQPAEARALVDRAIAASTAAAAESSPELLELGLWALVAAVPASDQVYVSLALVLASLADTQELTSDD